MGSLADENFTTGICSWTCFQRFYGLGPKTCWCGNPVQVTGAKCLDCQRYGTREISETVRAFFRRYSLREDDVGLPST